VGRRKRNKNKKQEPLDLGFLGMEPRGAGAWVLAGLTAWAAVVLWKYYSVGMQAPFLSPGLWARFCPPFWRMSGAAFGSHLLRLVQGAAFFFYFVLVGRAILQLLGVRTRGALETVGFGFGLGAGAAGLGTFLLGCAGLLNGWAVSALAVLGGAGGAWLNRDLAASTSGRRSLPAVLPGVEERLLAVGVFSVLAFQLFYSLGPVISFDALVYHLGLPAFYILEGGIVPTPTHLYSGMPMLPQWIYTFLLFFVDDIAVKLLQWMCGGAALAALLAMGRRGRRPAAGWAAALIFLGSPLVLYNITRPGVDVFLSYMVLLAVAGLSVHFSAAGGDDSGRPGAWLDLSAAACGFALGCKYTIWPLLPVLLLLLRRGGAGPRALGRFAVLAGMLLAPWVLKNLWHYGNPIFPYFQDLLHPHGEFPASWRVMQEHGWTRDWGAALSSGRALWETLAHPWFITVLGSTEFDHVGPVFLIGLPALLWFRPTAKETRLWLWAVFGLWLLWWPLTRMPRFFMPGLCLLSVLLGGMLASVPSAWTRRALAVLLLLLSVDAMTMYSAITFKSRSAAYLLGGLSKEEYLSRGRRTYGASYYRAAQWMEKELPSDARVLLLNGGRGYYLTRRFLTSSDLDADLLTHWLKRSGSAAELLAHLRGAGVTHIMANMAWVWRNDPEPGVTPEQLRVLWDFHAAHLKLLYTDRDPEDPRWVHVYAVVEDAGPSGAKGEKPIFDWYRTGGNSGLKRLAAERQAHSGGGPPSGSPSESPLGAGSRSPSEGLKGGPPPR